MDDLISRQEAIDALKDVSEHYTDKGREWHPHVDFMVEAIQDLPSAEQWIPVTERLPEEEVQVLITDDAGGLATIDVDCGYFDEEYGRFEWFHSQNVTAWMPLPEPYKEKNESQRLQV